MGTQKVVSPRGQRVRKLISFYGPYRRWLLLDLLAAFIVSATALALPLCARYITGELLSSGAADVGVQVALVGMLMLLLLAVQAACSYFVDYQGHMMGAMMESDMRHELFEHYQRLSFSFYDEHKTGQLMSRLTNDLFWLAEAFHHGPEDFAIALFKITGAFIILLFIDVPLTLMIFAFLPLMAVYGYFFNRRMNRAMKAAKARIGDVNAQVEDTLAGIRVVQSFAGESVEIDRFSSANRRFVDSRREDYRESAYYSVGMESFVQFLIIAVVIIGAFRMMAGSLSLPDLLAFLLYVGSFTEPLRRAVNFTRVFQEGVTGFSRFMDIMDIEPTIVDAPNAMAPPSIAGDIAFDNVSFSYNSHQPVLNDLSLNIHTGEYVALVGASGVGKTTLCSLIPRFYDVTAGRITIDGIDVRDMQLKALRQSVGVVQQDVYLFAGTVADNIRYGRRDATHAEIVQAATLASAHDFIMALPDQYDTDIGQRGVKLSGGQKQRLSIARVFLKNPPILIFDEATAALDNESEFAVQESIQRLTANRTMIVIAHRLSTIRNADRILVFTEDGIVEEGTHEGLIAANGTYAKLYHMQFEPQLALQP